MVGIEDLPNAIALNSMMFNGARTIGPALAGFLIYLVGTATCFFLNGVSYLAVIWSLLAMRLPRHTAATVGVNMLRRVREGMTYVWEHRPSYYLLLVVAINSGLGMQYNVLMPVFAQNILHAGPQGYGVLMGAQGVGAVIGAVALAWRSGTPAACVRALPRPLSDGNRIIAFGLLPR